MILSGNRKEPAPPAPPPADATSGGTQARRQKRDLSNNRISKRYVREGPSRRQKRQALVKKLTAHQMMGVIEKVTESLLRISRFITRFLS